MESDRRRLVWREEKPKQIDFQPGKVLLFFTFHARSCILKIVVCNKIRVLFVEVASRSLVVMTAQIFMIQHIWGM